MSVNMLKDQSGVFLKTLYERYKHLWRSEANLETIKIVDMKKPRKVVTITLPKPKGISGNTERVVFDKAFKKVDVFALKKAVDTMRDLPANFVYGTCSCLLEEEMRKARADMIEKIKISFNCFFYGMILFVLTVALLSLYLISEQDPRVAELMHFKYRYFTTWVVVMHIVYAVQALDQNVYNLLRHFNKSLKQRKALINVPGMFVSLLWPCTLTMDVFYWGVYYYDRNLIYPEYLDDIIDPIYNHALHTATIALVLYEVWTQSYSRPACHISNMRILVIIAGLQLVEFFHTLQNERVMLYHVFQKTRDYSFFAYNALFLFLVGLLFFFYFVQWPISDLFNYLEPKPQLKPRRRCRWVVRFYKKSKSPKK